MCRALFVLLLALVGASHAATHVNISIAQQPATNPADVSFIDGEAPAELKAGPYRMQQEQRFARLQERPQQQQQSQQSQQSQQQQQQQQMQSQAQQQMQSQQQPLTARQGLGLQPAQAVAVNPNARQPRRRVHSRRPSLHQQPPHSGQFRQRNQQMRQNQEFERYIQSYHSHGPSVETVS